MVFSSEIEWVADFANQQFSLDDWEKFLEFFHLDGDQVIMVPFVSADVHRYERREEQVKLRDLPKHKTDFNNLSFGVQTRNELVQFSTTTRIFKASSTAASSVRPK